MPDIPQEAVQAAIDGVDHEYVERRGFDYNAAHAALAAAAPVLAAQVRLQVAEEQRKAGLVVVSAEDLDVAIAYAARDRDGDRSPCVARLRAALDDQEAASLPPETPAPPQEET
ncbi:hypothetical protein [Nonomuraea sp. NPDC050202]|uniref:hypothetical protein n=1 Tax=Nonomuraea sp. NPDC050202 TaxID=3155035 RepID=UPI0033D3C8A8